MLFGAVIQSAAAQQNAAMFSTSTTLKQSFNTLDIADKARAAQAAQDSAQSALQPSNPYGWGMPPPGYPGYPGYGMSGYGAFGGGFNALIFAISYVMLGVFAIAFLLTYFIDMGEGATYGLSAVFLFFFSHHLMYLAVQTWNQGGYVSFFQGFLIFFGALTIGIGGGALWTFFLLDKLRGTQAGDITIGVTSAIAGLLVMIALSHRFAMGTTAGYAFRTGAYQAGISRATVVPAVNPMV